VGLVVAVAVLTHDFSDGINTAGVILKNGGSRAQALRWLILDAVAPAVGIIATTFFIVPANIFGSLLAVFAGFFLYIGASDLIPESFHAHPKLLTTFMTLLGAAVLYLAVRLAGL
jgi:ZIP family zinc transporter